MTRSVRPYQEIAIRNVHEALSIFRSTLLVMATGTGKTFTAAQILRERAEHGRILWIAHRTELIKQGKADLEAQGLTAEIEQAQQWATIHSLLGGSQCVVASVQTLQGTRMRRFARDAFAAIVIDEAHHATARSYREITEWFSSARVIGLTATPDRGDKVGLGNVFECVAFEYGIREAIKEGYLSPVTQKTIECADLDLSDVKTVAGDLNQAELEKALSLDAVLHQIAGPLVRESGDRSTIIFTAGVAQAHALVEIMSGYTDARCAAIDGTTPDELRSRHLSAFSRGELQYLFNCAVLTEGFDAPRTSCIAMARPTKSRALYAQCIGRGTRLFPGKTECLVLDFRGNAGKHKLVNPLDVLAGKPIPDDVREAAEAKQAAGMPSEEALAAAEREAIERAEKAERARVRAAKAKAEVAYRAQVVDPFGVITERDNVGDRATQRQVEALKRFGIEKADTLSKRAASKMFDALEKRRREGLCTYKQAKFMASKGLSTDLTKAEASIAFEAVKANGWCATPEMRARWGVVRQAEAAE